MYKVLDLQSSWLKPKPDSQRTQKKRVFYKDIGDGVPDKEANTKKVDDESTKLEPKWLRDPKGYGGEGLQTSLYPGI